MDNNEIDKILKEKLKDKIKPSIELENKIKQKIEEEKIAAGKAREEAMKAVIEEIEEEYPDAIKTDEGIYYEILKEGKGNPTGTGKNVAVEYKGYLPDGPIFDATKEFHPQGHEPLEFTTAGGQMIPGFDLMVQEMKLGETRKMVIPPELAYGPYGIPQAGIPGNAYICFDVTLIKN